MGSSTLWPLALCGPMNYKHTMFLCPWNYPSKNIGMSCCFLFQGIFSIQRSNLCLLNWQEDSLPLNHLGLKDSVQLLNQYSLDVLLFLLGTSLVHVQFSQLLPDLHIGFSRGRSGRLVCPSLSEFSTVYCDPHSQRLWHSQ